ncbi:MAG TPA: CBS domain-containing protein, partial [bacterium]|nr:CBS domain-containing protein [bacterium]
VHPSDPIEEVAFLMRRWKIGGLPVVKDGVLVGVITESDIFDAFVDLTGVRQGGARLTVDLTGHAKAIAEVAAFVESMGVILLSIATYKQNERRLAIIHVDAPSPLSMADALVAKGYRVLHYLAAAGLPSRNTAAADSKQAASPVV